MITGRIRNSHDNGPTQAFPVFDGLDLETLPINVHIDGDELIWWDGKESKRIPADKWSPETEMHFKDIAATSHMIKNIKLVNTVDKMLAEGEDVDLRLWRNLYGNTE